MCPVLMNIRLLFISLLKETAQTVLKVSLIIPSPVLPEREGWFLHYLCCLVRITFAEVS